jgi:hypothetical protein
VLRQRVRATGERPGPAARTSRQGGVLHAVRRNEEHAERRSSAIGWRIARRPSSRRRTISLAPCRTDDVTPTVRIVGSVLGIATTAVNRLAAARTVSMVSASSLPGWRRCVQVDEARPAVRLRQAFGRR